jgi:hypothetical protein
MLKLAAFASALNMQCCPFLNDCDKDENNKNVHIQVISTHKRGRKILLIKKLNGLSPENPLRETK